MENQDGSGVNGRLACLIPRIMIDRIESFMMLFAMILYFLLLAHFHLEKSILASIPAQTNKNFVIAKLSLLLDT